MAPSDPIFDTLGMEDVLFITMQCSDKVIAHKIAPTNRTLSPDGGLAFIEALPFLFLSKGGLLCLEFGLVERGDNFWHWQRDS